MDLPAGFTPIDLAFDGSGNLWLAGDTTWGDVVEMFAAGDLEAAGEISPAPSVSFTSSAFGYVVGSGSCLGGIDFDHFGDLWISVGVDNGGCEADTQLVEFDPSQLDTNGYLVPSVTISQNMDETNLFLPGPIRFGAVP